MGKKRNTQRRVTPGWRFARNALWLIGVSLFMRTVGVSFNVYLSGRAGGEVMGLHALLGGVYGLFMTLGCGGIHLGTTRLVAETLATADREGTAATTAASSSPGAKTALRRCLSRCLSYAAICGAGAGIILFLGAPWIGRVWLGDGRTVSSLRILALTLPPIALANALSGYFTAVRRVSRNALCGVAAQFARLFFCARLLTLWLPDGIEATCMALVLGGALSELLGLLLSLGAFLADRRRHPEGFIPDADNASAGSGDSTDGAPEKRPQKAEKGLTAKLLGITVPVTLAACLRSGLVTLEHALIPRGLKKSGASWAAALSSYGILHSIVLPVVLFPSAFISSFSGLLVPEVAESNARGDAARVARISGKVIRPALVFSFGVAGIMSCFAYELGELVCHNAEAGGFIRALAPLIPIMYVDSSVDAVLKGMGEQVYSMAVNIVDALTSVILVWILLPHMGLAGYIVTVYVTETLNTTLSLFRMLTISRMKVNLWRMVFAPLLCIVGASSAVRLALSFLPDTFGGVPGLILHISLTALLYAALLLLTGAVKAEEIRHLVGSGRRHMLRADV